MIKNSSILDNIFTVDDYINRKILGQNDDLIAQSLFVSEHTLERWKTKNRVKRYDVNKKRYSIITEMINNGFKLKDISNKLSLTVRQIRNIRNQFLELN